MRRWPRRHRWLIATTTSLMLLPLVGCTSDPLKPRAVGLTCPASAGGPVTLAVGARANSPVPTLPKDVASLLREAAKASKKIQVLRVDGSPSIAFSGVFRSDANNNAALTHELDQFMDQTLAVIKDIKPRSPEVDDLLALNEAARLTDSGGTVVLLDSGLQTTGQLRFQDEGMFGADPTEVTAYLEKEGQVPHLDGKSVLLVGLGNTADPQPELTDPSLRTRLTALWRAVAEKANAACVGVVETAAPRKSIDTTVPVTIVALPKPTTFAACGTTVLNDSGTVGFVADQATFRDPTAARNTLQDLATLVRNGNQRIELIGTTASAGNSEEGRIGLSKQRAEAVKVVLVDLGVSADRITTVGAGSKGPNHVNDRGPDGSLLPAQAARNRTVVVQLSCPTG